MVALSGLPVRLSTSQFDALSDTVQRQDAYVARATLAQFTKRSPEEALASLYRPTDRPKDNSDFLFFGGQSSTKAEIPASAVEKVSANLIVLDQKMRPVFATDVSLLAPTQ